MKNINYLKTSSYALALMGTISCVDSEKPSVKPNILICIMDDATYQHMGAYGCDWVKTPAFDKVAKQGLLFSNAYTPNAKCAPSRAAILTGRNSWQLEEAANHWCYFPEKFKTYAETLTEHGYHVGYTGKGWAPGVPGKIDGKERLLAGKPFNEKELTAPTSEISTNDYAGNFIEFLNSRKRNEPFCFWYGSKEPHRRYEYRSGIEKGTKNLEEIDKIYSFWPDNDSVRTDLLDYAFEIEYFDLHLGKMLYELEKKGELENTIVVVTADNGMPFPRIKGQTYELSNHLPLAIMWKKGIKNPGRIVDDFVNFIDFAPTFLEAAGIPSEKNGMQPIQGKSLMNIFNSEKSGIIEKDRDHILIGKERHDVGRPNDWGYPIRGIVKGEYLYIINFEPTRWPAGDPVTGYLNCDGSPTKTVCLNTKNIEDRSHFWKWSFGKRLDSELYNIKVDSECMNNLAHNPENAEIVSQLKRQLFKELKEQGDPRMFGKGYIYDEYIYADTTGVNFYERFKRGEKLNYSWVNETDFEKQD